MQLGLNKQLQPHEIKSYKHKIKNQTGKNRKQCALHGARRPHAVNVKVINRTSISLPRLSLNVIGSRSVAIIECL